MTPLGLPEAQLPVLSAGFLLSSLQPALIPALPGSLDSLLASLIGDALTGARHNANRELVGQGIGNTAAGFIGAMAGAGATLGMAVNIRSGGNTPVSGALRSVILLGLALGLGSYVADIPLAVRLVNAITAEIRDHQAVIFDFTNTAHMYDGAAIMVEQMIDAAVSEAAAPHCYEAGRRRSGQPAHAESAG